MPVQLDIFPDPFISIRLVSGVEITATCLLMRATYAGLLEGMPKERHNERRLASLKSHYQSIWGSIPVHVIAPEVIRFERPGSFEDDPPRMAALLPPCEIAAVFESRKNMEWHHLIIVWHQAGAEPLMTPEIRTKVAQLDWAALAEEVEI